MTIKILISRCFLGEKVRYDGRENAIHHNIIKKWSEHGFLVPICPEVAGGLAVPRPPAEIHQETKEVFTNTNRNVTAEFQHGASIALSLCQQHGIQFALLKESSPSCGSMLIYDGHFTGTKIKGEGVTTTLLKSAGIKVYSEKNIEILISELDGILNK